MEVTFEKPILIESYAGTSQKGNEYGRIRFLSSDLDVFEVFCSADSAKALIPYGSKHQFDKLSFDLTPDRSGGVRLVPRF